MSLWPNANAYSDCNGDTDCDINSNAHGDSDSDAHADRDANGHGDANASAHYHSNSYGNSDLNTDSNCGEAFAHTETASDSSASSTVLAITRRRSDFRRVAIRCAVARWAERGQQCRKLRKV